MCMVSGEAHNGAFNRSHNPISSAITCFTLQCQPITLLGDALLPWNVYVIQVIILWSSGHLNIDCWPDRILAHHSLENLYNALLLADISNAVPLSIVQAIITVSTK